MARTARVLGLTLASALTATALSVTGPTALAGSAAARERRGRPDPVR